MELFLSQIKARAKANPARLVFAEDSEARVRDAIQIIEHESTAIPLRASDFTHLKSEYAKVYAELRKTTEAEALTALENPHVLATMMVLQGEADGMIAGPTAPSRDRILPALQLIKTKEKFHKVSGFFFMVLPADTNPDAANGGIMLFADCAVNVEPNSHELADIAIDTAMTAKRFGIEPKIAMLSFSTAGSTNHPLVKKVQEAADMVKARHPELSITGDIQVDAALIDSIAAIKDPKDPVAGHANVLIFPDLEAGNIGYKLVERLAGAKAIGPVLQGLRKPVNELSRGSSVDDIVNLAAITSVEAMEGDFV